MHDVPGLPPGSRLAEHRLGNGVRTLAIEVPTARQVRLVAAVGVGYLDEPMDFPGLAHLLEHALFLGSPRHPTPGDFAAWIGEQGGRYNAHTDEYVTDVHLTLPSDAVQAGLERLLDLILRPYLIEPLIAREVEVIEAEFRARLADPALHRQRALSRLFQPSHPAFDCHHGNRQSLGTGVTALQAALESFHARHYRAERMSLVMLGPEPLERQRDLLATAANEIPAGATDLPARTWRWAAPTRVQWCLPGGSPPATPALELLWPLPDPPTPGQRRVVEHLAHILGDGELAAMLQRHNPIRDLDIRLAADGGAAFLSLALPLSESGHRHIDALLATCQAWVERSAVRLTTADAVPVPTSPIRDLDAWPKTLARRLVVDASALSLEASEALDPQALETLAPLLNAGCCRTLEPLSGTAPPRDAMAATGTRFRYRPQAPLPAAWIARPAPAIARRDLLTDDTAPTPGLIVDSDELTLWWGDGPPLAEAFWCLAWAAPTPMPTADPATRLIQWRQHTLALRQAAAAQNVRLTLGIDDRGGWVIGRGDAALLESCVAQLLTSFPTQPLDPVPDPASHSANGLLAQRLLARLETRPTPPRVDTARILAWAGGTLSAAEAQAGCRRLMASHLGSCISPSPQANTSSTTPLTTPSLSTSPAGGMDWPVHWLPPQGDDQAVMLQIDAVDASPTSQALFQLLGQCHDAAFHHELRQRRRLGYVAAVRYREAADGWPRLGYVVQSPRATVTTLRQAVSDFLEAQGVALATLDTTTFTRRRTALRAQWGTPETHDEALARTWRALRRQQRTLTPWQAQQAALDALTAGMLKAQADALVNGRMPRQWWAHTPTGDGGHRL
ncbi:insulinase family protein [Halomonas sp. GXIMD04776]|uniref:insulinase family protein n=1 Tax=Halomonas sp. GXIMD04776 TaxID=3415605 RepID=UPI003CB13A08